MPSSRGKKPSKTRSNLSAPDRSPSTRPAATPSSVPRGSGASEETEDEELSSRLLGEAAAKFPSLISETAFQGRITEVESSWEQEGRGACLWLSEASMVSSSLSPDSLVSVSLAASGKQLSDGIPLDALSNGYCKYFGLDFDGVMSSEVGRYFAIAKVFSSQKVLKNGVKLSWSLSCTMGFPASGRMIFVFPIGNLIASNLPHGAVKMDKSSSRNVSFASLCMCRDLHLRLIPLNIGQMPSTVRLSTVFDSVNSSHLQSGDVSSPKTPSCYQPKLSSPSSSPIHFKGTHNYISSGGCYLNIEQSAASEIMKDEKCGELLQMYAVRWFNGRYLLNGNMLALPIFGQFCIFQVESAIQSSVDSASKDQTHDKTNSLFVSETEMSNPLFHLNAIFLVGSQTKVHFTPMPSVAENSNKMNRIPSKLMVKDFRIKETGNLPRLGGLSREYALLREIIGFSFSCESFLPRYKGVLLHGPPGTGKTSLACSCAHDAGANLFVINGPDIISEYYGKVNLSWLKYLIQPEELLLLWSDSYHVAVPITQKVFIDELDAIAPARKEGGEGLSLRLVATLLELMDGISRTDGVLVIAASNRPDSVDPALRRPGRLDREIEIGVPTPDQRLDILSGILNAMQHALSDKEIQSLALATHGFVGADLSALCNEAAMIALRRYIKNKRGHALSLGECRREACPNLDGQISESQCCTDLGDYNASYSDQMNFLLSSLSNMSVSPKQVLDHRELLENITTGPNRVDGSACVLEESSDLHVTAEDFEQAKLKIRPSAMREVMLEVPKVCWEDVGGQNEVKRQLIEAIQWPQTCPEAFKRIGIRPPRGLLMFGPPGCSKTLMARAVASEAKLNFLAVKGPELLSKWVGESEKAIRSLFAKARANSPSIIFFDEIDGLATTRGRENDGTSVGDRVMSQLLIELNGLDQRFGVTVIAATNRPDKIDPALLRPGRFDRHLDVRPPDVNGREEIFRIHMRNMPVYVDVTARELAQLTEGYSGADIKLVCREAAIAALEESFDISEVSMAHFKIAIGKVQPADVQIYLDIAEKFKRFVDTRTVDE